MKEMDSKIRGEGAAAANAGCGSGAATHRSTHAEGGAGGDTQTAAATAAPDAVDSTGTELAAVGEYVVQRVVVFLVNAANVGEADAAAMAEISKARVCF